jgi:hypothetical protein
LPGVRRFASSLSSLLTVTAVFGSTAAATEHPSVAILVLKEHGVGSPTLAQPYLDKFVAIAAEQNDWPSAKGQYFTNRSGAEAFIAAEHPHYAILSIPAFLALKQKYGYHVIGQVAVKLVGGRRYYLISKNATDLAGCRGKSLASDHTDDRRFIEKVVAAGQFTLADFTLIQTPRPLQTITKVLTGEAECALIDDAQFAELAHLEGAEGVHPVWTSRELPPMALVVFPNISADERTRFQENLSKLCDDDGESICAEVGIVDLKPATDADYAALVGAYGK